MWYTEAKKMEKVIWEKGLVVSVIVILCSLAVMPVIRGLDVSSSKEGYGEIYCSSNSYDELQEHFIDVELVEYKPDGSIVKRIVPLKENIVNELKNKLTNAITVEERFPILKEYGLIPDGTLLDDWEKGMYEKAEILGLTETKVNEITSEYRRTTNFRLPILLTFFSKIGAVFTLGGRVRMGFPSYVGMTKFFRGFRFFDLVDVCWGLFGVVDAKNFLRGHSLVTMPGFMCLAGFVGIHIHIPLLLNIYTGYSAMTFAAGLGFHDVTFLPWIPR